MDRPLRWETDGRDWPNRHASRFVEAGRLTWHVQIMGEGPVLLLAHGTGASTHSWRGLAPLLAPHFRVVAPDLPGHAFTATAGTDQLSLRGMAASLTMLLGALDLSPAIAAGHSAGAAILARMCLDKAIDPAALISLNGALTAMRGVPGQIFSPIAKLLSASAVVPRLFAWRAGSAGVVERLIRETGSRLDAEGIAYYRRLIGNPAHVAATLQMMAEWDLHGLERDLPRLETPLILVAGGEDRAVPPQEAFRLRDAVPRARVEFLRGLGHLAHEERPGEVAELILRISESVGAISAR